MRAANDHLLDDDLVALLFHCPSLSPTVFRASGGLHRGARPAPGPAAADDDDGSGWDRTRGAEER